MNEINAVDIGSELCEGLQTKSALDSGCELTQIGVKWQDDTRAKLVMSIELQA